MERERADALVYDLMELIMETVRDILPRYVGMVVAARVMDAVRRALEQEWATVLDEEREEG